MSLVREWGYALGLTGRGVALWNDGAIGVLLRGMPLGGRGYILKSSNANDPIATQSTISQIPKQITVSDRMITSVSIEGHQCVRCSFMACPSTTGLCNAGGWTHVNWFTKGAVAAWHSGA